MTNSFEVKQERSIPVQARVDIVSLADLAMFLENNKVRIKTMSFLIGVGIDMIVDILKKNNQLDREHKSIDDACETMNLLGIWQRSMKGRSERKLSVAKGFENLRAEGVDPAYYAPGQYKTLHNVNSVQPKTVDVSKTKEIMEVYRQLELEGKFKDQQQPTIEDIEKVKYEPDNSEIDPRSVRTVKQPAECAPVTIPPIKPKLTPEEYQRRRLEEQKRVFEEKNKNKLKDTPRHKTEDELLADAERIAKKDRDIATADMSAPKGKAIDD
jgi:hypothetical protein